MALVFFVLVHSVQQLQRPADHSAWGRSPSRCLRRWSSPLVDLTTINIYSQVGLITLAGTRGKERDLNRRVCQPGAARGPRQDRRHPRGVGMSRLRPVLMTTGATVLGHFPLVLVSLGQVRRSAQQHRRHIWWWACSSARSSRWCMLPAIYAVLSVGSRCRTIADQCRRDNWRCHLRPPSR